MSKITINEAGALLVPNEVEIPFSKETVLFPKSRPLPKRWLTPLSKKHTTDDDESFGKRSWPEVKPSNRPAPGCPTRPCRPSATIVSESKAR